MDPDSKSAFRRIALVLSVIFIGLFLQAGSVNAGTTTRVSVDSDGNEANGVGSLYSYAFSADGRYVAFESCASNLVASDTNRYCDIFIHDRQSGQTTRVSVDSDGNEANGASSYPALSADGRYVAFWSDASNLVANDTNALSDIFIHDRQSGQTTRVSANSEGKLSYFSRQPALSADGRYLAFWSEASNLVANDTNALSDIFVHDRQSGQTTRVSVDSDGNEANGNSRLPSLSAGGRYVAFWSEASNLVAHDTYGVHDIFIHDRQSGQTTRVSVDSDGNEAFSDSWHHALSANGRFVTFESSAINLVANKTNVLTDIFVHDRHSGQTTRVSVDSHGNEANGNSYYPSLSADGRFVTFESSASNLVANDTNGVHDIFVHDRQSGQTSRVSVNSDGNEANGRSHFPKLKDNGRYVAFTSYASNLVANDTNGAYDIFVHERDIETPGTLFYDDMESGLDKWTLEGNDGIGGPNLWTHTQHRYSSVDRALYYGKTDTLDYNTGKRNFGTATSVPIDLTTVSDAYLSFSHFLRKEPSQYYDIGRVQVSTDEGASWEDVHVVTQSTAGDEMQRIDVRLTAYVGQIIRLRFSFDTVDGVYNNFEGWVIDDVMISETKIIPYALFHDDMESGSANWIVEGDDGSGGPALWHLSQHRFTSATNAFYYGKSDTFDYDTGGPNSGAITSVPIDQSDVLDANLSFQHFLRKENSSYYDAAKVQVSIDDGVSWEDLHLFSNSSEGDGFQKVDVSLSAYAGQVIRLRYSFDSVDRAYNNYAGWVIDDVLIEAVMP